MLGLKVTYLRGSVTAADIRSGHEKDHVEWPPHPDRLFCALTQAWGDLGEPERGRKALLWLEGLPPPLIQCGTVLSANAVPRFVPVNDEWSPITKKKEAAPMIQGTLIGRVRQPRRIPSGTLSEDAVIFWWPDANPSTEEFEGLAELANAVASLGHSSSLVSVEIVQDGSMPQATWAPRPDGEEALRVFAAGRLDALVQAYRGRPRRRPPPGEWLNYGAPMSIQETPRGHHRDLIVFRLTSNAPALALESASQVIAAWRRALLAKADQPVCEAISGHAPGSATEAPRPSQKAHLALLPLGDIGHRYARGHLLGVAAALPDALPAEDRRACLRALGRVDTLTLGRLGLWRLERCDASETRRALLPGTWSRPARTWGSVTPVVFGKYPKDLWGDEAAAMVREACGIAGLPPPLHVATAPVAWVLGVPPAPRFPALPSRPGKPRRAHVHVLLTFAVPVAGPLLVGAGRHQGYGLFRQLAEFGG